MPRLARALTAAALAGGAVLAAALPASAYAEVDDYELTCSSFAADGTTNASYIGIYVYPLVGGDMLLFEVIPVEDVFSFDLTFSGASDGEEIVFEVFGSDSEGTWDEQPYFQEQLTCELPPPTSSTTSTTEAPASTTSTTVAAATATRVTPTFTG